MRGGLDDDALSVDDVDDVNHPTPGLMMMMLVNYSDTRVHNSLLHSAYTTLTAFSRLVAHGGVTTLLCGDVSFFSIASNLSLPFFSSRWLKIAEFVAVGINTIKV